jgi:hypothetical protein
MEYLLPLIAILVVLFFVLNGITLRSRSKSIPESIENAQLLGVLLGLNEESREELFKLYRQQFGANAARYAKRTYLKWQTGKVRPTSRTFERFLINLPKAMSFDLKCEILRTLRKAYCAKDHYEVVVDRSNWREELAPLVNAVVGKANDAELPDKLQQRLRWLAENDARMATIILQRSQKEESIRVASMVEDELSGIGRLVEQIGGRGEVVHLIQLPLGTITVRIKAS